MGGLGWSVCIPGLLKLMMDFKVIFEGKQVSQKDTLCCKNSVWRQSPSVPAWLWVRLYCYTKCFLGV